MAHIRFDFPTNNLEEYCYYLLFNTGPGYIRKSELFHYTNFSNRALILKEKYIDLRFTRTDCFTDQKEVKHIIPVLKKACRDCLKIDAIDKEFSLVIKNAISNAHLIVEELRKHYVFCFSANGKSGYLKENYACKHGADGIIIGIQGSALENIQWRKVKWNEKAVNGVYLCDVIYDKQELQKGFFEIIRKLYEMRAQDSDNHKTINRAIIRLIAMYGLAYKAPSFAKEEETRMVVDVSRLTLPKEKFHQDDDKRYLHIKLPVDALYDEVIVNV